jgi:hypothetical protein
MTITFYVIVGTILFSRRVALMLCHPLPSFLTIMIDLALIFFL